MQGLFKINRLFAWLGGIGWQIDAYGRAFIDPTYGSEVLTNGGMEAFSSGLATSWTKGGTPTMTQESTIVHGGSSSQKMVSAGTGDFIYQYASTTAGKWYRWEIWVYGAVRVLFVTNTGAKTLSTQINSANTWTRLVVTGIAVGTTSGFLISGPSGGGTGYIDDASIKEVTGPITGIEGDAAGLEIGAELYSRDATIGVVSKVDSLSNPQNYVVARFDALGNIILDKVVAGVTTNLQSNATTFVSGYELKLQWMDATTCRVLYNGAQIGINRTVSDAGITSNTKYGLIALGVGCKISRFELSGKIVPLGFPLAPVYRLFAIGDSKTAGNTWVDLLAADLQTETGDQWVELTPRYGIGGASISTLRFYVDANLPSLVGIADKVVINVGVNDVTFAMVEATWKLHLVVMLDTLRAKWPSAQIYVARTWSRGYATEHNTLATWIAAVVATYPSGVHLGMDERVWLENGDNGVTYTSDGVHYTTPAQQIAADNWMTAMGY